MTREEHEFVKKHGIQLRDEKGFGPFEGDVFRQNYGNVSLNDPHYALGLAAKVLNGVDQSAEECGWDHPTSQASKQAYALKQMENDDPVLWLFVKCWIANQ